MVKLFKEFCWYFKYTCLKNMTSVTTGAMLALLTLIVLTCYFSPVIAALISFLANILVFSMITFNAFNIKELNKSIQAKSTILGGFIGNVWVTFLYLIF